MTQVSNTFYPRSPGQLWRSIASGSLWAFSGKALTLGSGVMISILVARLLTPEQVGAYFLAVSVVTVAAMLARAGLERTVLRLIAESLGDEKWGRAHQAVVVVIKIAAITTAAVAAIMLAGGSNLIANYAFASSELARISYLLSPWICVLAFELLLAEIFRGYNDIAKATLAGGVISRVLTALILLSLLATDQRTQLHTVALVWTMSAGISVVVAAVMLRRRLRTRRPTHSNGSLSTKTVLQESWPLLISNLVLFTIGHVDIWILGAYLEDGDVGIYAVPARLVALIGVSLTVVNAVLPPLIGQLYVQGHRTRLERVVRLTATVAAIPSVLLLLVLVVRGGDILALVWGPHYRAGAPILAVLSIGQLANVWVGSCGYTLIMTGHQRELMWSAVLSGLLTTAGGLILIGAIGAFGVAIAVAGGLIVQQVLMLGLAKRCCGIWTHVGPLLLLDAIRRWSCR